MIIKFRNRLIALTCFLLFLGVGAIFLLRHSIQKPFGIILFIGDGMSPGMLTATRLYQGGADNRLTLEEFPQSALTRTYANDFAVSDAASAATALSTGEHVNNRSIAMDPYGKPLTSLLEEAAAEHRMVGLISNGSLMNPTAAAFYGKSLNAYDDTNNATQLSNHANIDLLLGGGRKYFSFDKSAGQPTPSELLNNLKHQGTTLVNSLEELSTIPKWKSGPILGLLADDELPFSNEENTEAAQPSLSELVKQSIERLQHCRHGYFLVVDDALIAKAASSNNAEQVFREIISFDQALSTAYQYAGPNTLIIVTGKQNLGGLRMNGYPFRNDKGVAVLGVNAQGTSSITWSTGPGHNIGSPSSSGESKENASILAEPTAFSSPSALGVAEDTITVATGPYSEQIHGFIDLTAIHDLIKHVL